MIAMGRVAWEDELLSNSYVNQLGATVWIYDDGPGGTDLVSGHTYTTMSKYLNEFIEDAIPGGVDCVVGFCHMAEYIARAAALRPDLVRSVVLASTAIQATSFEERWAMHAKFEGLHQMWQQADPPINAFQFFSNMIRSLMQEGSVAHGCFGVSKAFLENTAAVDRAVDEHSLICDEFVKTTTTNGLHISNFVQHIRDSKLWSHWDSVSVPVLCIAGADDPACLDGIEWAASMMPRSELKRIHGVVHVPQIESPEVFRDAVIAFVRKHTTAGGAE